MASPGKSGKTRVAAGIAATGYRYAKRVDWPAVWMRAKWLSHHSKRLYNNLSESERQEFMRIVVPTKGTKKAIAKDDRTRLTELVTKAFSGNGST